MKPTFALDLTRDTIALLHRTPKGWLSLGEVAFDAPDLDEALDYLRKTALGLSPKGIATKIILPASQVLYTEISAPGPSREEKRRQIAAGLEGLTPYPVEDLVFDWSGKGATVKVAVVARETLDEAEAFAVTHRLNPVSIAAIPHEGSFVGEAWFGPTAAAASILAEGEKVERDRDAVVVLQRELPQAETAPAPLVSEEVAADSPASEPDPAAQDQVFAADDADDPLPGLYEALNADLGVDPTPQPLGVKDDLFTPKPEDQTEDWADTPSRSDSATGSNDAPVVADTPARMIADAALALEIEPQAERPETDPSPDFQTAFANEPEPEPTPVAEPPVAEPPIAEPDEAPFAHVTDTAAFPDSEEDRRLAAALQTDSADDIPPAPPSAAMVAFASRRAAAAPLTRQIEGALRPDASAPATKFGAPTARTAPVKGFSGLVTAPSIPGTRAKPKPKLPVGDAARAQGLAPTTVRSPARPGGTFGSAAPPRNRSGVVFMVLVALLLLCLALLAAWSSFYLARNDSSTAPEAVALVEPATPGVDDEMLADMQDPEGMIDPLPEADGAVVADVGALATESVATENGATESLDTALAPMNLAESEATDLPEGTLAAVAPDAAALDPAAEAVSEADAAPLADAADTAAPPEAEVAAEAPAEVAVSAAPEPAPDTTVATDLVVAAPPAEDQDEIILSSMDAPPPALDALPLPIPAATRDAAPDPLMPPPAFGTVYQFDAKGLLLPTPDGILSPDGVFLIAGKPPLEPPSRSEIATAAALAARAAPAAADPAPADPAAPAPAPAAADASLFTAGDVAADAGTPPEAAALPPPNPELAGVRPRARPASLTPPVAEPAPAAQDDAALATESATAVATLRPLSRPESVLAAASSSRPAAPADLGTQSASLVAQAEAKLAAAAALEAENPSIVAISLRPAARPGDLSNAVEAAVAAAVRAPEPEAEVIETAAAPPPDLKPEELDEVDEPQTASAAPSIPTKASVAKQATFANAINLSKLNLIGTYGTDSRRSALIRQSNGRYKKVKVGDRIDGGTIKAITETEVRYQKGGKLLSLKLPKA